MASEEKIVPYKIVGGPEDYVKVEVDNKQFTPPEISAMILRKLKEAAEAYLGHKVNKAVITVPAYFNDAQRQATKDAGQIAGLEVARIINEPTAASLAYGLDKKKAEKIVRLRPRRRHVRRLRPRSGRRRLPRHQHQRRHAPRRRRHRQGVGRLRRRRVQEGARASTSARTRWPCSGSQEACEKAKKELSSTQSTDINLPFITADASGPKHLQMTLTRAKFEQLVDHLFERCRGPVNQAMKDAHLGVKEIDEVVLVGGSTRMPKVQDLVARRCSRQGAAQGRQSRRGGGRRRRHPGRRAGRRSPRRAAAWT